MQKLKTQFDKQELRPSLATPSCCCSCCCCSCVISTLTTSVLTARSLYKENNQHDGQITQHSPVKKILYVLLGICLWPGFVSLFFVLLILSLMISDKYSISYTLTLPLLLFAPLGYGAALYFIKKDLNVSRKWILKETILPPFFFIVEFFTWIFGFILFVKIFGD